MTMYIKWRGAARPEHALPAGARPVLPRVHERRPLECSLDKRLLCTGIINSEGRLWKSQRRFLHEKLREFGMTYMGNGKKIMEGRIKVSNRKSSKKSEIRQSN